MEKQKFEVVLTLIVQRLVMEIVNNENITEREAVEKLYSSELYKNLEIEDLKLWHLSPKALYVLYDEEQKTGKISFPEEM